MKSAWHNRHSSLIKIALTMENDNKLTEQEQLFCDLFANGEAPFGGNAARCYQEVFNDTSNLAKNRASRLLARPHIQEYLKSLDELTYEEAKYMKIFLRENLTSIIQECTHAEFRDRKGTLLSPAALRSVAVNATKALMDLYPVKEAQISKINIDGGEGGGITFNVIMPDKAQAEGKES